MGLFTATEQGIWAKMATPQEPQVKKKSDAKKHQWLIANSQLQWQRNRTDPLSLRKRQTPAPWPWTFSSRKRNNSSVVPATPFVELCDGRKWLDPPRWDYLFILSHTVKVWPPHPSHWKAVSKKRSHISSEQSPKIQQQLRDWISKKAGLCIFPSAV